MRAYIAKPAKVLNYSKSTNSFDLSIYLKLYLKWLTFNNQIGLNIDMTKLLNSSLFGFERFNCYLYSVNYIAYCAYRHFSGKFNNNLVKINQNKSLLWKTILKRKSII